MTKSQTRAAEIAEILEQFYPETPTPLTFTDPYTLLVAVLLSAQCTDDRVNKITPELWKLASNCFEMANSNVEDIKAIIRPCGLSTKKSDAILRLSKILVNDFDGIVPQKLDVLKSLPGVGHKTASVVMAQAFGIPSFPVDTHIHRLAYRWKLSTGKNVTKTERDCKKLFDKNLWNKLHLQIIFFGREYCPARRHNPQNCPICKKYGRAILFD